MGNVQVPELHGWPFNVNNNSPQETRGRKYSSASASCFSATDRPKDIRKGFYKIGSSESTGVNTPRTDSSDSIFRSRLDENFSELKVKVFRNNRKIAQ